MLGSKFYLNFRSRSDIGRVELLSEPVGFDSADFAIVQEDGRMGRDITFAGGTGKFQFSRMMHPEVWDKLQSTIQMQGFEAVIDLEIDYAGTGNIVIIGNLDIYTCENDTYDLIKTDVVLDQDQSRIKKNEEAKTDLFSDKDIDGMDIVPVTTARILNKAKPLNQLSSFKQPELKNVSLGGNGGYRSYKFNYANNVIDYGIDNTLSFIQGFGNRKDFGYVEALENLNNVRLEISNLTVNAQSVHTQYPLGYGFISMYYYIGSATEEPTDFYDNVVFAWSWYQKPEGHTESLSNASFVFDNLTIRRGQRLYLWFESNVDTQNTIFFINANLVSMSVKITGTSTSYSSVNEGIRLLDAVKYNVKSAGRSELDFTIAQQYGKLYDNYLFSGNTLRNIIDKPFYMTFKQIREWFGELNLDYEIENTGVISIGNDKDFYPDVEIGILDNTPQNITDKTTYTDFIRRFNEEFTINLFEYKYKNYQSQKENDVANTYDAVHGELQLKLFNQNVNNKKEVNIEFIRDPFLFEDARVKALSTKNNTATQDDDKIFILDVYPSSRITVQNITFNESDTLMHNYDDATGRLTLSNQGNFSFALLGILVGYKFRITSVPNPQFNQGLWTVQEVSSTFIVMTPADGTTTHSSANNGERYTNFEYYIRVQDIAGMTWTNEDFQSIENIANPQDFGNLRFSQMRNIRENYESYLATCNIYHEDVAIRNNFYKNNPEATTTLNGITLTEGEDFIPRNPILTPYLVTQTFVTTFDKYFELMQKTRSNERGFIRCFGPNGEVIRLYVKDMRFRATMEREGTVTFIGKEKYMPYSINISTVEEYDININNEYRTEFIRYELKNNYFYIKDENGKLLYNRLTFKQISINGQTANSQNQLQSWLNQYTQ